MAGHSQFKNIMHRKGAKDAIRSKVFGKLAREITVSAKMGMPDPDHNPRLRAAIIAARAENMPKDNIERAIKKAIGGEGENYESVRYEGYGPGGTAIIAEALTDNRNRTAGEVRAAFTKHGGTLGETNSVAFMFDQLGLIHFSAKTGSADAMLEAAIEAGADDCESSEAGHDFLCPPAALHAVREALAAKFGDPESAKLVWRSKNTVAVDEEGGAKLLKLLDALDDNDDVQTVFANYEMSDEMLEKLTSA